MISKYLLLQYLGRWLRLKLTSNHSWTKKNFRERSLLVSRQVFKWQQIGNSERLNFKEMLYYRHGQSAAWRPHVALQPIFAALGPFYGKRKSNIDLLLPEIWSKTVNNSIIKINFFLKFGPQTKKCGHPCCIISGPNPYLALILVILEF